MMTDPFSITVGVVGLLSSIASLSIKLNDIRSDFGEAKTEVDSLLRELTDLTNVLKQLQDTRDSWNLPDSLSRDLGAILQNCNCTAIEAEIHLRNSSKRRFRGAFWAISGKKESLDLCRGLEAYKATISITLNLCSVQATCEILSRMDNFLSEINQTRHSLPPKDYILQRYLDDTETYAETILEQSTFAWSEDISQNKHKRLNRPTPPPLPPLQSPSLSPPLKFSASSSSPLPKPQPPSLTISGQLGAQLDQESTTPSKAKNASKSSRHPERPDLVIAVNVGNYYTAVAYALLGEEGTPVKMIQRLPGAWKKGINSVPTLISYSTQTDKVSGWGHLSLNYLKEAKPVTVTRAFCQEYSDEFDSMFETMQRLEKCFVDYFSILYGLIEHELSHNSSFGDWESARIEFIFKFPDTWIRTSEGKYDSLLRQAGIDRCASHYFSVARTFLEEQAVALRKESPSFCCNEGDTLIIIQPYTIGHIDMDILLCTHSEGLAYKSLQSTRFGIDWECCPSMLHQIEELIANKIIGSDSRWPVSRNAVKITRSMMRGFEFRAALKACLSSPRSSTVSIPVPGLPRDYKNSSYGIKRGSIFVSNYELVEFHLQRKRQLTAAIARQLKRYIEAKPSTIFSHLIEYSLLDDDDDTQARLLTYFQINEILGPAARDIRIIACDGQEVWAAQGLVYSRLAELEKLSGYYSCT